jgi:hypothetical protein
MLQADLLRRARFAAATSLLFGFACVSAIRLGQIPLVPDAGGSSTQFCFFDGGTYLARARHPTAVTQCCDPRTDAGWVEQFNVTTYPLPDHPYAVTAAVLDNESSVTLVVASDRGNSLYIFSRRDGGGDFELTFSTPTGAGSNPVFVAAADLALDGHAELLVVNATSRTLVVYRQQPDGGWQPDPPYSTGADPLAVAIGDFNGDGILDAVVTCFYSSEVDFFAGVGGGSFSSARPLPTAATPTMIAVGRFANSALDLATANAGGSISVILGDGTGGFAAERSYPAGNFPVALAGADLDSDGNEDLIVVNAHDDGVGVFRGLGDGTFEPQRPFVAGPNPNSVAVGDIDGDGRSDIAVGDYNSGNAGAVAVLWQLADGGFSAPSLFFSGHGVQSLIAADINGDGALDLITVNSIDQTLTILTNACP